MKDKHDKELQALNLKIKMLTKALDLSKKNHEQCPEELAQLTSRVDFLET
jgi:hypothetical protein